MNRSTIPSDRIIRLEDIRIRRRATDGIWIASIDDFVSYLTAPPVVDIDTWRQYRKGWQLAARLHSLDSQMLFSELHPESTLRRPDDGTTDGPNLHRVAKRLLANITLLQKEPTRTCFQQRILDATPWLDRFWPPSS